MPNVAFQPLGRELQGEFEPLWNVHLVPQRPASFVWFFPFFLPFFPSVFLLSGLSSGRLLLPSLCPPRPPEVTAGCGIAALQPPGGPTGLPHFLLPPSLSQVSRERKEKGYFRGKKCSFPEVGV